MRLQEIYCICSRVFEEWPELSFSEKKMAGGGIYHVLNNTEEIKEVLSELEGVPSLLDSITAVKRTSVILDKLDGIATFDSNSKSTMVREFSKLENSVGTIAELFDALEYAQNENGIDIKMPPHMSLADLSKCIKDLDMVLTKCPILTKMDGHITLSAVDVGSIWLNLLVVGTTSGLILKTVAEIVDKALIIRSHYLTNKEQEERLRSMKLENDAMESVVKAFEQAGKNLLDEQCADLAEKHQITDAEEREKLKHNVDVLANWMSKGLEIYAAVNASPEVKAVFPPIESQSLPEKAIKLLTSNEEEN